MSKPESTTFFVPNVAVTQSLFNNALRDMQKKEPHRVDHVPVNDSERGAYTQATTLSEIVFLDRVFFRKHRTAIMLLRPIFMCEVPPGEEWLPGLMQVGYGGPNSRLRVPIPEGSDPTSQNGHCQRCGTKVEKLVLSIPGYPPGVFCRSCTFLFATLHILGVYAVEARPPVLSEKEKRRQDRAIRGSIARQAPARIS